MTMQDFKKILAEKQKTQGESNRPKLFDKLRGLAFWI